MIDVRTRKLGAQWARWLALALAAGVVAVAVQLSHPAAAAKPKAPTAAERELLVDVVEVESEAHAREVTATGQLAPAESVNVVSELSRRLVQVGAEEGARVKRGQVLFAVDASDLVARKNRLRVSRDLAQRILARREVHSGSGAITDHELDVARTEVAAADAEIHEVNVALAKTQIRAPFDGVLGTRHVSTGAWVTPDVVLTTLYDTSRFKIDFTLPERFASELRVGGTFTFSASGAAGEGEIAVIEPAAEASSRSIRVRGVVDARDGLVAGTFAEVRLGLAPRKTLFVPTIAVEASPEGHSLWLEKDGKAVQQKVEIGERTAERMEITKGLASGERVIVSNLLRLKPGASVRVAQSSKAPAPAPSVAPAAPSSP